MPDQRDRIPIIRTKLYRPTVGEDTVKRKKLISRLNQCEHMPLVMIVAPAGYGKSTLISQWIQAEDEKAAWLSLEKSDNDLRIFVSYLIAALRTLYPGTFKKLGSLMRNRKLPAVSELAWELNSELDALPGPVKLVLDDYHRMSNPDIHELMEFQLRHIPADFQLFLLCRRDPPLPLATLQAKNLLSEVRLSELMFSLKDTTRFFSAASGVELSNRQIEILHEALEGWPVGLRLIMLTIQSSGDPERLISNLPNGHPRIQRYLIEEVLSDLDPVHRACMSRISLLDRFCEPLNRALCSNACKTCSRELNCMFSPGDSGKSMVWNPLSIPLDGDGEWFRYHHQFQKLLQEHLHTELSSQEIHETYHQASVWLETNGFIDESIKYAFRVSPEKAIAIVSRNRHSLMNKERWVQLRQWVKIFDQTVINASAELLLLQAWCNVGYPEMFTALEKAGTLLSELQENPDDKRQLGELLAYRSLGYYVQGDGDEIVTCAQKSLKLLESDQLCEKGFASILLAMGMQLKGEWVEARDLIQRALGDDSYANTTYHTRLWAALCFGFWNDADTHQLKSSAREYLELGRELRFAESIDHGLYFCGLVHYAFNELEQAQKCLTELIENPSVSNMHNYFHAAYVLALSYVASDQSKKADALVEKLISMAMKSRQPSVIAQARAFEAEIALRTGRIAEAEKWLLGFNAKSSRPILWRFYVPHFTRVRVLLALGDPESVEMAIHESADFYAHTTQVHHTHSMIISLIQHALALWAGERTDEALKSMSQAVELALPGGAIRLFVDEGGQIAPILNQLKMKPEALRFTGRILAAFRDADEDLTHRSTLNLQAGLLDPLSSREREVLTLLAGPLENKAIAEKLFISPGTVKRHTNSIYSKLSVHSRRAAVDKARGLGLLDA